MLTTALVRPIRRFNAWENCVPQLKGRFATFTSANDPRETESWNAWYQSTHTPDAIGSGAFVSAVRCEAVPHSATEEVNPTAVIGGNMAYQYSHVTLYDIERDDVERALGVAGDAQELWQVQQRMHPNHSAVISFTFRPSGKWGSAGYRG